MIASVSPRLSAKGKEYSSLCFLPTFARLSAASTIGLVTIGKTSLIMILLNFSGSSKGGLCAACLNHTSRLHGALMRWRYASAKTEGTCQSLRPSMKKIGISNDR
jgi:hypothetical protein